MTEQEIKAYNAGYDDAVKDFSMWHPASELPKEEGVYIVIPPDCEYRDVYYAEYKLPYGWCYDIEEHYHKIEIQWWCYPPKED